MTKALIAAPFIPISKFAYSHRGAQGVIYADMIRNTGKDVTVNMSLDLYHPDFNEFDELYVYHGNDWGGDLNLFGGLKDFPYTFNFVNFSKFKGKVYSLAIDFPDYHAMLWHKIQLTIKAGVKPINPLWNEADWDNLLRMQREAVTVKHPGPETHKIVIGDSHAICLYRPGWMVNSVPHKTLHGALKEGLSSFCASLCPNPTHVDFYFGNIDVRHHLARQPVPEDAVCQLADEYVAQACDLHLKGVNVSIYELLPIEDPKRTIPKTGWFEGTPYFGSWEERKNLRDLFCDIIDGELGSSGPRFVRWTRPLLNEKDELDFRCMEQPKSVHLSRAFYPHWQGSEYGALNRAKNTSSSLDTFF